MKKYFSLIIQGVFAIIFINVNAYLISGNVKHLGDFCGYVSEEVSLSNNNSFAHATFTVSLSSGISPLGAKISLVHLQLPDTIYSATVPESGEVVMQNIYPGFYQVYISRFAYKTHNFKSMIDDSQLFEVVLMQETQAVSELGIDDVSLLLSWLRPQKNEVLFEEDFSSGSFETQGWVAEPPNWVLNDTIGNEQPSACFMGVPHSSQYSFSLTSKIVELAGSPALHLYYDIYLSNIDVSIVEMMAAEIWCGQQWNTVNAHDADGIEIMPWTTETIDISDFSADNLQFRFRAYGNETNSVEYWSVDNIAIIASDPDFPVLEYNVYLDDSLTGVTTDTKFFIPSNLLQYGQQYTAGVDAVYESGISERVEVSFTSWYLPPPQNLQGECVGNDGVLTWDLPDIQAISNPEALEGFSIYREGEWIVNVPADSLAYVDANLMQGVYSYEVIAIYDLTYLGFSGTGYSLPVGAEIFINDFGFTLPSLETWDSASFDVNGWIQGGNASDNWKITSMKGNPPPAAEFSWDPPINDYESWLMSPPLNAAPYDCADYYIEFDLNLEDRHATGKENLSVQIYANNTWRTLKKYVNSGNTAWESHKLQLPDQSGNTFYIRFLAEGENSTDIYRWMVDNIYVYADCRPPKGLWGKQVHGDWSLYIEWTEPDCQAFPGELVKLNQWDGPPTNGYFQSFGMAYGVVYDLSAYPDAILDFIDFHHASWGVLGTWSYKVHVVDWDKYVLIETLGPFQTTGNDKWENGIQLGQITAYGGGKIGIMLEPMSNSPTDAYPCFSADNVGPNGVSLHGNIPNWSAFAVSGIGDFLQNLWIRTTYLGKSEMVRLYPVNHHLSDAKTRKPAERSNVPDIFVQNQIIPDIQVTNWLSTQQQYNVYRNELGSSEFELLTLEPVTETYFYDDGPFNIFLTYYYYVTAIYDACESIPSNIAPVNFIVDRVESIEQEIVQVFPVPADQSLSVVLTDQIRKLRIINIFGQMVYEQSVSDVDQVIIDISSFPAGIYFIRFYDGEGLKFVRKVMIAR